MCNPQCLDFGKTHITQQIVEGASIIEVGSRDINGSLRGHCIELLPKEYVGIDIQADANVDVVCDVCELASCIGESKCDLLICTEVMEHVFDWRNAINNMKAVIRDNGLILLTTRSKGFGYHGYPHDYWRYEIEDMRKIFADFEILALEKDCEQEPGVLLFAKKLRYATPVNLNEIELYDIRTEQQ